MQRLVPNTPRDVDGPAIRWGALRSCITFAAAALRGLRAH